MQALRRRTGRNRETKEIGRVFHWSGGPHMSAMVGAKIRGAKLDANSYGAEPFAMSVHSQRHVKPLAADLSAKSNGAETLYPGA